MESFTLHLSPVHRLLFIYLSVAISNRLSGVKVDAAAKTAWVEAGAILGSVYYNIAQKSFTLGFPGGFCATVGVSVGGYGSLLRKYGMAADQVIDAMIVDVNGRILDRKSIGDDLFLATRGGVGCMTLISCPLQAQSHEKTAMYSSFMLC